MSMGERKALDHMRRVMAGSVRSDLPDLTARQTALLMTIALQSGPHTVRGLAADLNLSKPVVTRAIDKLSDLGFVLRSADQSDLRSVLIERTRAGMDFLRVLVMPLVRGHSDQPVFRDAEIDGPESAKANRAA